MISVSVIIPSYKPGPYLIQCLDSLINQSLDWTQFEVLIVLNGCNEPYYSFISDYIITNNAQSLFRLYQTDASGVSNARNIGLNNANGEYVAFIDDDDFVSSSYLEELLSKASIDTIAISNEMKYNEQTDSFQNESFTLEYKKDSIIGKQPYYGIRKFLSSPCMKLIHHDIIASFRYDTSFTNGEDSIFMFAISKNMRYVDFTSNNAIYFRRSRNDSAMSKERSPRTMVSNRLRMIRAFMCIYIKSPRAYSFRFLFSRIMGCFHSILNSFKGLLIY